MRDNRLKSSLRVGGLLLSAILLPLSCTQLFTTSLATWAARDASDLIPTVKASNVRDLIELSASDPKMSLEVLKGIESAIAGASAADKAALQAASLDAASNASGVGPAIIANAGDIASTLDGSDDSAVQGTIVEAISGLGQLAATSASLMAILPDPATEPAAFTAFVAEATAEDLAAAAIVLLAAEAKAAGDPADYVGTFDPVANTAPAEALAVALADAAAAKYAAEGGTGPLADILSALGLY